MGTVEQEITAQPDPSCTYARYGVHDYWVCSVTKTFSAAKSTCEGVGMHLARLDNVAENDFVKSKLGADSWIGATDSAAEGQWRWINDNAQFWSGNRPGNVVGGLYNKWTSVEPNDLFGEDCGIMVKSSGEWNDVPCGVSRAFVCESSPATGGQPQAPDTACTRSTRNGSTYWNCSNARTWDTARANCQSVGAELVSIDDAAEASFLAPSFTRETYVGLSDKEQEGTWRWNASGLPSFCGTSGGRTPYGSYSNWASGQPIRGANDCQRVESDSRAYWICRNQVTWDAAKAECAASGMTLARIDNAAENALIAGKITMDTWLGGTDRAQEGQWRWTDNVQFWSGGHSGSAIGGRYTNFETPEPNDLFGENCLLMYGVSGKWNDSLCDAPLGGIGFVCEGPKTAGPPDANDCVFAASGGKWSSSVCTTPRAYICESVPTPRPKLEEISANIRENHTLGTPRVMGFEVKVGVQVKEPFLGQEARLGLRACDDALEPTGTPYTMKATGLERVAYAQTYQGIPVLGRGYAVQRHPHTKNVVSVLGDVSPNINAATVPVLTQTQALAKAAAAVGHVSGDYSPAPAGKLRILPKTKDRNPQWELGWVFSLPRTNRDTGFEVGVSAVTGDVILKTDNLLSCVMSPLPAQRSQGRATVNAFQSIQYLDPKTPLITTGGTNTTYPTFLYSRGTTLDPLETPEGGIRPLYDAPEITTTCGNQRLQNFAAVPDWSTVMQTTASPIQYMPDGVTPPTDEQAGAAAFLSLQTALDAVASVFQYPVKVYPQTGDPTTTLFPWKGIEGFSTTRVNLHIGPGGDAYMPPEYYTDGTLRYPGLIHIESAAPAPARQQGAALDVVAHELAHAIWRSRPRENDPELLEGREIGEGYADIVAATVEAAIRLRQSNLSGQFCLGGDPWQNAQCDRDHRHPLSSTQNSCTLPDGTRTGCCVFDRNNNPIRGGCPSDYQSPEFCKAGTACTADVQTEDCCDVHNNATILDHWHYLVTVGDAAVNSNTCKYHVRPLSTNLLESSKAAGKIVFNAVRDGGVKDWSFPVMAEATIKAATELFGANSDQVKSVMEAWYAVNVREQPFYETAKLNPKRGDEKVHPWVTFAWPVGPGETAWDLQIDDKDFTGPSPRFSEPNITTTAGEGAQKLAYFSVALPENSDKRFTWRVRPHSTDAWADCYAVHWFKGTGPLTEPKPVTFAYQINGVLQPGVSSVMFPQMPGVLYEALTGYKVQFSQNNVACQGNDPCVGPACVTEQVGLVDGPLHVVYFSGTQPGATYYGHVQAVGPIHIDTRKSALGPCVTETINSGPPPQAPSYLRPANGERFGLSSPHKRDPLNPASTEQLELKWSVQSWMKQSRVRFKKRTETGCSDAYEPQERLVPTPESCTNDACPISITEDIFPNPYPGGYCWEVKGIAANGTTESPPAVGSWTYFVDLAPERSPGAPATSGTPTVLGGTSYGKNVDLTWGQVASATGYKVNVWKWTSAYGTEQFGNPTVYPGPNDPDVLPASANKVTILAEGRYCWELTPILEDPATAGQGAAVQPKVNAGGPICFTTGPKEPKLTFDKPLEQLKDGEEASGKIEFGYIPDEKYWTNQGQGWNWVDGPEPWCVTYNQVYRDVVNCTRKFKVPYAEGKDVLIHVKAYDGTGAPGTTPSGTHVFEIRQPVKYRKCGAKDEPCCNAGNKCEQTTLACSNADKCATCGVMSGPCCTTGAKCGASMNCESNSCNHCGNLGEKCCDTGTKCGAGLDCPAGRCEVPKKPDLTISKGVDYNCGYMSVDVVNEGDAPSGEFDISFDGVDCCGGVPRPPLQHCPSLVPGGVCHREVSYGCYMAYIRIVADANNVVAEKNESNNAIDEPRCPAQCGL